MWQEYLYFIWFSIEVIYVFLFFLKKKKSKVGDLLLSVRLAHYSSILSFTLHAYLFYLWIDLVFGMLWWFYILFPLSLLIFKVCIPSRYIWIEIFIINPSFLVYNITDKLVDFPVLRILFNENTRFFNTCNNFTILTLLVNRGWGEWIILYYLCFPACILGLL
jgi:hypothetical protein